MIKYPTDALLAHENIVWEYETDFVEHFWKNGYKLASVSFGSDSIKVVVVAPCGQHIADSFSVKDYHDWLNTFSWYKEVE